MKRLGASKVANAKALRPRSHFQRSPLRCCEPLDRLWLFSSGTIRADLTEDPAELVNRVNVLDEFCTLDEFSVVPLLRTAQPAHDSASVATVPHCGTVLGNLRAYGGNEYGS